MAWPCPGLGPVQARDPGATMLLPRPKAAGCNGSASPSKPTHIRFPDDDSEDGSEHEDAGFESAEDGIAESVSPG